MVFATEAEPRRLDVPRQEPGNERSHLAQLDGSPLGMFSAEAAAARREAAGHTGSRSSSSGMLGTLASPAREAFLPVGLVQPQWVELILTNRV